MCLTVGPRRLLPLRASAACLTGQAACASHSEPFHTKWRYCFLFVRVPDSQSCSGHQCSSPYRVTLCKCRLMSLLVQRGLPSRNGCCICQCGRRRFRCGLLSNRSRCHSSWSVSDSSYQSLSPLPFSLCLLRRSSVVVAVPAAAAVIVAPVAACCLVIAVAVCFPRSYHFVVVRFAVVVVCGLL